MNKTLLISLMLLSLYGCGGGGSPVANNPNTPNDNTDDSSDSRSFWHNPPKAYDFAPMRIAFSRNYMYLSVHDHIMRTDGKEFKMFKNSYDDSDTVQFVDLHGRMYLYDSFTDDGFEYKKDNNYTSMAEYCADSLTTIICNYGDTTVGRRTNKAFIYKSLSLNKKTSDPNSDYIKNGLYQAEPGSNGRGTFIIPEKRAGILISLDDGLSWNHILTNKFSFTAVAGNINHPTRVFAGRVGEMYTSSDTGVNWHKVTAPTYKGKRVVRWDDIELLDDGTLIALTQMENATETIQYLYKSNDFAKTWKLVNKGKSYFQSIEGNDDFYFASGFVTNLHIAPR